MADSVVPASENEGPMPWALLESKLRLWLAALQQATSTARIEEVIMLLEALVRTLVANDGTFLSTVVSSGVDLEQALLEKGAPASFVRTFKDVIKISGHGPRLLSFGPDSMMEHVAAELIARFEQATRAASPTSSPTASSPASSSSPRRANRMLPRPTLDMLEQLERVTANPSEAAGALECITSLQLSKMSNAVVTSADALPPAVIDGLTQSHAIPFLFFRWLTNCLLEVLFCIYHSDTTFVVKRKIVYVHPKPGTQIEGHLAIEGKEEVVMLEGPCTLPWVEVAGLLEAPAVTTAVE